MPYIKLDTCPWCKGVGRMYLIGHKPLICPNCHGTGKGGDGGRKITDADHYWKKKNKFNVK